jgi:hypothetical protein
MTGALVDNLVFWRRFTGIKDFSDSSLPEAGMAFQKPTD